MKKLAVVGGAGGLGSTMGFYIGLKGLFQQISLVDIKENILRSHVMDMAQGLSELSRTEISCGSWENLSGSDVVIITASVPALKVASRNEFLKMNLGIVQAAAEQIGQYCPKAVVITATAPVDVYNYVFYKILGGNPRRFIGFCRNDSLRLRWAVGQVLREPTVENIEGWVLGEHGETQVPIYGSVKVNGKPAALTTEQIMRADASVKSWFTEFQSLDSGRTSSWTSTTSITKVLEAVRAGSPTEYVPGSVILEGQYGLKDVSLGVPVRLGPEGWHEVLELELTEAEQAALEASAKHVRDLIDACL